MTQETLNEIKVSLANPTTARNSMGCSENFYNSNYMLGRCFTEEELSKMSEQELQNLFKLADFAADVFY